MALYFRNHHVGQKVTKIAPNVIEISYIFREKGLFDDSFPMVSIEA
jgi:hypothetical protein